MPLLVGAPASADETPNTHYKSVPYDLQPPYMMMGLLPPTLQDVPDATYRLQLRGGATDYAAEFQNRVPVQLCVTFDDGDKECTDVFIKRTVQLYEKPVALVEMWVYSLYVDADGESYGATRGTVGYWLS